MIQTISLSDNLAIRLVDFVLERTMDSPFQMAKIQIILPTKRACRTIKETFLKRSQAQALLLPKLIPLYELDNLETDIPPSVSSLERTLLLARLCQEKPSVITPEQAIKMAISLGDLLDEFYQFETDVSHLRDLVPEAVFADHWNETLIFLDIITHAWPSILSESGQIDEADRRIRMINAYTENLKKQAGTDNPLIIAAGLDGGLPAVRRLLQTIDSLQNNLILTDGADTTLTEEQIKQLPSHHYQGSICRILNALGKTPKDIRFISDTINEREKLIREALKPETRTDEWRQAHLSDACLNHVTQIECDTISDEALTIALLLREALEKPGQTASLVTSDRCLARRVILEMRRWGITLDDSAGTPLSQTNIGVYLKLLTDVALSNGQPSSLLSLLKHPLSADKQNPMSFRQIVKQIEKQARQDDSSLTFNLNADLNSFVSLFQDKALIPFETLLTEHMKIAEDLAESSDRTGAERLWSDEAGTTAFEFLTNLREKASLIGAIEPIFYPDILSLLMNSIQIRPLYGMHPRLDVLGPIEARFHHFDVCIIGGLNEGTFPSVPDTGPWLNRPMRQILGLPSPEEKASSTSMDFAHCFCSPIVYLTRSKKTDGAETIPSRFWERLSAVLQGSGITPDIKTSSWAKLLDMSETRERISPPAPCPPVEARPCELSATRIETLRRNPYAVYASHILKLYPLPSLEEDKKQKNYGIAIHAALEKFIRANPNNCDKSELLTLAEETLRKAGFSETDVFVFMARFEETANFIIEQQTLTQGMIQKSLVEQAGKFTFDVNNRSFTLTGKVDRIDFLKNGETRIIDYKTGTLPSDTDIRDGYAPQLPLEAFLFSEGGFEESSPLPLSQLLYWKLDAQKEKCKATDLLTKKNQPQDNLISDAFEGLKNLIYIFYQPDWPYNYCPNPRKTPKYDDYTHLARVAEWNHDEGNSDD